MSFGLLPFIATFVLASPNAELKWAADAKSGVPFMFVDPSNPKKMQGFELDIMTELSKQMGRSLTFVQNEWESLVPGLARGDYDVAANGLEVTPERAEQVLFSEPYYATFEQIVVHAEDSRIENLSDLDGKKVGTLKASLAHTLLERETKAKIMFYDEEDQGYTDVANQRIDAFFMDYPIALYYAKPNPKLKVVGPPIGKMFYAVAVSKDRPELIPEINAGLQKLKASGELEKILAKWNLLHPFTSTVMGLQPNSQNQTDEFTKISAFKNQSLTWTERLYRYWTLMPMLLKGALTSIQVSIVSMVAAIAFGLIFSTARLYGNPVVSIGAQSVVELLRGTPLLIQLYLIFFGLPYLGINLSPFWAAVLGLGLNYGAYEAENYRAGIEAVPKAQLEAAQALALSPLQRFRHVIFPQAYRIILPPMTNDFISLIKDSSLVSVITMVELTTIYSQLASTYFDHLGLGVLVALVYFAIGYPFVRLARRLERNLKRKV
jgi:polar amino acid transport system substrate-binding protein